MRNKKNKRDHSSGETNLLIDLKNWRHGKQLI